MFDRYPCLRQVIVNTKTDRTFRGVLWRRRRGYLILRQAQMLRSRETPVSLDGDVLIESSNVDFLQVIGG